MSKENIPDSIRNKHSWGVGMPEVQSEIVARIPSDWKEYILKNSGVVYVLSGDTFESPQGWQTKSKSKVTPHGYSRSYLCRF
jgi:hypothetical protein